MPCFCYYIFGLRSEENLDIGTYPQISKLGHKEILQKPYWNNFKIIFLAVLAPYVYCFSAEFRDASQHGIFFFFAACGFGLKPISPFLFKHQRNNC